MTAMIEEVLDVTVHLICSRDTEVSQPGLFVPQLTPMAALPACDSA
jgi:hypothetical protein